MNEFQIFEAAYGIEDQEERELYLEQVCAKDAELRKRLDHLLAAAQQEHGFLSVPAHQLIEPLASSETHGEAPTDNDIDTDTDIESVGNKRASQRLRQIAGANELGNLSFLQPSNKPDVLGELGPCEVLTKLGQGGFGSVFKAFDKRLNRLVAIKIMAPELVSQPKSRERFLREARSAAAVRHPNIVMAYEVEEQPVPYIVMELIDGPTLQQHYDSGKRFSVAEVISVGQQIASALATAHAQSIIHLDIKPSNILLDSTADQFASAIKITDFGLARAIDEQSLTQSGLIVGTPMYMSPEQALGEPLDDRADLFSLGSVLYMLATGRPPFADGSSVNVMRQVVRSTPPPIRSINAEIPDWLCQLIAKLQTRDRAERLQSAAEVEALLADGQAEWTVNNHAADAKRTDTHATTASRQPQQTQNVVSSVDDRETSKRRVGWLTTYCVIFTLATGMLLYMLWLNLRPTVKNWTHDQPDAELSLKNTANDLAAEPSKEGEPTSWAGWPEDAPRPAKSPFSVEQAQEHQERWAQYLGVPREYTDSHQIKFVLIPPGEFQMGVSADELKRLDDSLARGAKLRTTLKTEAPRHLVTIPQPFYLSICEVTQGQYHAATGLSPSRFSGTNLIEPKMLLTNTSQYPVERVSWNDAIRFCNRLSESDNRELAYKVDGENVLISPGTGYRLPSEAEWEFACRAGTIASYWPGPTERELKESDWFRCEGYTIVTKVVGQLKPNPFGLYDMHGNVTEWTEETFIDNTYSEGVHLRTTKLPPANVSRDLKVCRGGSYLHTSNSCRSTSRSSHTADWHADSVGFRVAISLPVPSAPTSSR